MKSNREGNFLGKTSRLPGISASSGSFFVRLSARNAVLGERMIIKPRQAVSGKGERKCSLFIYAGVILLAVFILSVLRGPCSCGAEDSRDRVRGDDKTDFLLVPFVLAVIYAVLANSLGLPLWKPPSVCSGRPLIPLGPACPFPRQPPWHDRHLISFGDSFRVGIDEKNPAALSRPGCSA